MAKLTPEEILRLSEPIEKVYSDTVDALLINMAKHFNSGYSLSTQEWEIRKLAELGQLNKESVEIIASLTGQNPALVKTALENAVYSATRDIEPELKRAVKGGHIDPPAADNVIASGSIFISSWIRFFPACLPDIGKRMDTTMVAILLWQNYYGRSLSEPAGNAR